MSQKIKLIIFDLDGTLVNSSVDIANAMNYAIAPYGQRKITVEEAKAMVGEGIAKLIEKMVGPAREDILPDVLDRFIRHYSEHLADFTRPYPGVPEALGRLKDYIKVVLSNKREAPSKRLLEMLGLYGYFAAVLGGDSVEEMKPSAKPVIQILKMFSISPEEAVIVGDSNFDIEAGRAAGVNSIAVTYGFRSREQLKNAGRLIDTFDELAGAVAELEAVA